jgi:penicillin-binding protein 1A
MSSMLQDVIKRGTGARARELERGDLAGKTGTTNDQNDAWFSGFNRHNATTVWVGFDRVAPLGKRETGAQAALPMWIDFMRVALAGVPETRSDQPAGMVTVRIDPDTGLLVGANHPRAIFESFPADRVPGRSPRDAASSDATDAPGGAAVGRAPEQIF